jgi:Uncharacterized conserved protein (some members contain a von Willebrand factor type A (vWA) domain)
MGVVGVPIDVPSVTADPNASHTPQDAPSLREPLWQTMRRRFGAAVRQSIELSSLFPPGTKDIRAYPYYTGSYSRWVWRFHTHRLTRAGNWFLLLTFLLALFGSISLEIQTHIPFLYAMALWLVALVALPFQRPRARVEARHAPSLTAGETLQVDVAVTSEKKGGLPQPDLNIVPIGLPPSIDADPPSGAPLSALGPGETARVRLGLVCRQRGAYTLPGYRLETDYPFGLVNAYRIFRTPSPLIVYPAFTRLSRLSLPVGERYQPGGVALAANMGDSFEFLGNREFREGDNIRDIDWRATARMGGAPIVREWREEYFLRVGIVLDTHLPRWGLFNEQAARRAAFERAVSVTASVSDYMARQEYLVDLFAAGPDLYHLSTGRGLAYLEQILDILAVVETTPSEPLSAIEPELLAHLSRITTVICVFLCYDEVRREFVEKLRANGVGVKVILTPATLPEVIAEARAARDSEGVTVLEKAAVDAGAEEF